jgi:GNAT superfamily N-acetyltransferase
MIEIRQLNKKALLEYIHSPHFRQGDDIPITVHRALSQINNPRLHEKDVILLLAYNNDILLGYLGILPDFMFLRNGTTLNIGWLSCFWVSEHARGKGIGSQLMKQALDLYNNNILSADYVPLTKKVYDKSKQFADRPYSIRGIRFYIKSDLYTILPPKKVMFSRIKWLLKAVDFIANLILDFRVRFFQVDRSQFHIEYVDQIDDEINDFIISRQGKQLFKREKEDLNWIINNPWVLSAPHVDTLNKRYHFSSTAEYFDFHSIKIKDTAEKMIGLMIFSQRNGALKLPYFYHDNCLDIIVNVLNFHIIKWKIKTFTTFHPELVLSLKESKTPALFTRELLRNYMVSSVIKNEIFDSDIEIQDGDGDCCFT